jgi:hypothetical protein
MVELFSREIFLRAAEPPYGPVPFSTAFGYQLQLMYCYACITSPVPRYSAT